MAVSRSEFEEVQAKFDRLDEDLNALRGIVSQGFETMADGFKTVRRGSRRSKRDLRR